MTVIKDDIINNITKNTSVTKTDALSILNSFISMIASKSKLQTVKISNFGTFRLKTSPSRVGRNPKTKEKFLIPEIGKCSYYASNKIKRKLN